MSRTKILEENETKESIMELVNELGPNAIGFVEGIDKHAFVSHNVNLSAESIMMLNMTAGLIAKMGECMRGQSSRAELEEIIKMMHEYVSHYVIWAEGDGEDVSIPDKLPDFGKLN